MAAGIGLTASAFASGVPRSKAQTQFKSVHGTYQYNHSKYLTYLPTFDVLKLGTARQTQNGFVDKEPAMDGLDVRKVVQGKGPNDKY